MQQYSAAYAQVNRTYDFTSMISNCNHLHTTCAHPHLHPDAAIIICDFKTLSYICSISRPPPPRCWGSPASTANRRPLQGLQGGGTLSPSRYISLERDRNTSGLFHKSLGVAQCLPFYPPGSTRGSLERRKPVRDPAGLPGEAWAGCASGGEEVFSSRNLFVSYLDLSLRMPPPHSPPGPLHS